MSENSNISSWRAAFDRIAELVQSTWKSITEYFSPSVAQAEPVSAPITPPPLLVASPTVSAPSQQEIRERLVESLSVALHDKDIAGAMGATAARYFPRALLRGSSMTDAAKEKMAEELATQEFSNLPDEDKQKLREVRKLKEMGNFSSDDLKAITIEAANRKPRTR